MLNEPRGGEGELCNSSSKKYLYKKIITNQQQQQQQQWAAAAAARETARANSQAGNSLGATRVALQQIQMNLPGCPMLQALRIYFKHMLRP